MNKTFLLLLASVLVLSGCAHGYIVTLNNGQRIHTPHKPKLVNGFYYFKDDSGRNARPVLSANVSEIAPASIATDDQPKFNSAPPR